MNNELIFLQLSNLTAKLTDKTGKGEEAIPAFCMQHLRLIRCKVNCAA